MNIAIAVGVVICVHLIVRNAINQWHKKGCTECQENIRLKKYHQETHFSIRQRLVQREAENNARYIEVTKLHRAHAKKSRRMQLLKDILSEVPPMIREKAQARVEERRETARIAAKATADSKRHADKRNHAINLEAEARKAAAMA